LNQSDLEAIGQDIGFHHPAANATSSTKHLICALMPASLFRNPFSLMSFAISVT
jgi:hypothetical protein